MARVCKRWSRHSRTERIADEIAFMVQAQAGRADVADDLPQMRPRNDPDRQEHDVGRRHADLSLRSLQTGRIQSVAATPSFPADTSKWSSASAGVFQSSVLRGRELRAAATAAISSALFVLRSVPLGKYWRSSPLVFSLVPRCHGLCGSQK